MYAILDFALFLIMTVYPAFSVEGEIRETESKPIGSMYDNICLHEYDIIRL